MIDTLTAAILVGIGATALTDVWGYARKPLLGIAPPDYGMVGRWMGHMAHGQFRHEAISKSPPVHGERLIGWTAHYLIGIAFAGLLIAFRGQAWLQDPDPLPALV